MALLSRKVDEVQLDETTQLAVDELLRITIKECSQIVEDHPEIPAFRFALARCQIKLASRPGQEFESFAMAAL